MFDPDEDSLSGDDINEDLPLEHERLDARLDALDVRLEAAATISSLSWCHTPRQSKRSHEFDAMPSSSKRICDRNIDTNAIVSYTQNSTDLSLMRLPLEILENILSFVSHGEQSKIRLSSQRFRIACENELNTSFQRVQTQVQQHFSRLKAAMPRRESARRKHPLARECDIIETLHMRLTLLQMTFGKYIERNHCCFFAGEIVDEVKRIMYYVRDTNPLGRAYKVTDELFDLSSMAMEYFKEKIEPVLPEISYFSTDFPEFSPPISSPSPVVLSLDHTGLINNNINSTPVKNIKPAVTPVSRSPLVLSLKRGITRAQTAASTGRREIRIMRRRTAWQSKQLQEATSKLEQHERRLDENERRIDALVSELLSRRCSSHGNNATTSSNVLHKWSKAIPLHPGKNIHQKKSSVIRRKSVGQITESVSLSKNGLNQQKDESGVVADKRQLLHDQDSATSDISVDIIRNVDCIAMESTSVLHCDNKRSGINEIATVSGSYTPCIDSRDTDDLKLKGVQICNVLEDFTRKNKLILTKIGKNIKE